MARLVLGSRAGLFLDGLGYVLVISPMVCFRRRHGSRAYPARPSFVVPTKKARNPIGRGAERRSDWTRRAGPSGCRNQEPPCKAVDAVAYAGDGLRVGVARLLAIDGAAADDRVQVWRYLGDLDAWAHRRGVTVLGVAHPPEGEDREPLQRQPSDPCAATGAPSNPATASRPEGHRPVPGLRQAARPRF